MIEFFVPGVPIAQPRQRHRVVQSGGRAFAQNYTPAKDPVNAFKAAVRFAAAQAHSGPPLTGPVALEAVFLFPRPGRLVWKKRAMPRVEHTGRPDWDNLGKSLADSLTGLLWIDDAQLCSVDVRKLYASGEEQPGVSVKVHTRQEAP